MSTTALAAVPHFSHTSRDTHHGLHRGQLEKQEISCHCSRSFSGPARPQVDGPRRSILATVLDGRPPFAVPESPADEARGGMCTRNGQGKRQAGKAGRQAGRRETCGASTVTCCCCCCRCRCCCCGRHLRMIVGVVARAKDNSSWRAGRQAVGRDRERGPENAHCPSLPPSLPPCLSWGGRWTHANGDGGPCRRESGASMLLAASGSRQWRSSTIGRWPRSKMPSSVGCARRVWCGERGGAVVSEGPGAAPMGSMIGLAQQPWHAPHATENLPQIR